MQITSERLAQLRSPGHHRLRPGRLQFGQIGGRLSRKGLDDDLTSRLSDSLDVGQRPRCLALLEIVDAEPVDCGRRAAERAYAVGRLVSPLQQKGDAA